MRKRSKPGVPLLALALCCAMQETRAQEPATSKPPVRDLQVSDIFIPAESGQISETYRSSLPPSRAKQLILIQDAHLNLEAQRHVAAILDRLASDHGLTLILVEGGAGDASLAYLRGRGTKAVLTALAEQYLQEGLIAGEEYLDITSEHQLVLWGIDDPALHEEHVKLFLEGAEPRARAAEQLAHLRAAAERLVEQVPNEPLRAFDAQQAAFEAGTLSFSRFMEVVRRESHRAGIRLSDYPQLAEVIEAASLESALDSAQVAAEQREAMDRLRPHLAPEDVTRLKAMAETLTAGQADPAVFYRTLDAWLSRAAIPVSEFPALQRYVRYVQLKATLEARRWIAELSALCERLRGALVGSPDEAALLALAARVARCERLARLEWTPEDLDASRQDPAQLRVREWLPQLQERSARAQLHAAWPEDPAALEHDLAQAVRFYELAAERDDEMVRRALEKMDAEGERVAALIAGGFHTDHLIRQLKERGVSFVVVTPWVGEGDDQPRYAARLRDRYEHQQRRRQATDAPHAGHVPEASTTQTTNQEGMRR